MFDIGAILSGALGLRARWRGRKTSEPLGANKPAPASSLGSKTELHALFECVADALWLQDRQGRILDANRRACEGLGYSRDELLALSAKDIEIDFDDEQFGNLWNTVVNDQSALARRTLRRKDGSIFLAELRLGLFRSDLRPLLLVIARNLSEHSLATSEPASQLSAETQQAIAEMLLRDSDIDAILDHILAGAQRVVPCDTASIMLVESEIVRVVRCRGYAKYCDEAGLLNLRLPLSQFATWREMVRDGTPVVIADTQTYPEWIDLPGAHWVRSQLSVPIRANGQALGFLVLESATLNSFTTVQAERLLPFTQQAAVALRNAHLQSESQRRIHELSALIDIVASITSTLDLEGVLQLTMQQVQDLFQVERCSLMLLDEQTDELVFRAAMGAGAQPSPVRLSVGQGIASWVLRAGQPALVNDVRSDPRWYSALDPVTGFVTRSILGVPLKSGGRVIGVLETINKVHGQFTENDLRLLESISMVVGQAVENARLFSELTKAYRDSERTQALILESRNTLRALFDTVTDSICIVDRNLRIRALNRAAATAAGAEIQYFIGRECQNLICMSNRECDACIIRQTLQAGTPITGTNIRQKDGGTPRELEERTYPLKNLDGEVERAIYIGRDVTAKREMEAALIQSTKLSAVGQLAAGVAHEINNPMTAIIANAQMLLETMDADDSRRTMAQLIERAGLRASRVVRNLLDFSRQEEYHFEPTDLNATIEDALLLITHQLERNKIHIVKNLQPDLPMINASASHLQSIWMNLLVNAQDAVAQQSAKRVEISTRLGEDGRSVQAIFSDNGPGIPEKDHSRVFDPFFTTKAPGKGTGLGLAISYAIAIEHEGTIQVKSREGEGVTFIVTLPAEDALQYE